MVERCWLTPPVQRKYGVRQAHDSGHIQMFDSREDALEHRDAVVEVLQDTFGEGVPWHSHPVLDGAVVRIEEANQDQATSAFEEAGFSVNDIGVSGDWFELKVKP